MFFYFFRFKNESPLLHSRFRKSFFKNSSLFFSCSFGLTSDYITFPVFSFGNTVINFFYMILGKFFFSYLFFFKDFFFFKLVNYVKFLFFPKFNFFLGSSLFYRFDSFFFFYGLFNFIENSFFIVNFIFSYISVISDFLGRISAYDVGFFSGINSSILKKKKIINSFIFFVGCDFLTFNFLNSFLVYLGSFDHFNFNKFFIILPSSIFVENFSFFMNLEGLFRKNLKSITAFFSVFSDVEILKSFFYCKTL